MLIFAILIFTLYFITHVFLNYGLKKSLSLKKNHNTFLPQVSVIVAARNEQQNIVQCIKSLSRLNYPEELLEIILVNDKSTDKTYELINKQTKDYKNIKIINSEKSNSNNLKGKANAIDTAIKVCKGEIIMTTDADCEVPSSWVQETIQYYDDKTAMVCGFTKIKLNDSLFAKLQCIDWIYLLTLASSSAGFKMLLSCVGNNLSFRKDVYYELGGYKSIKFSVTEDLALMRKINSNKKYKIKYPVDIQCLVQSLPCENLRELFSQKRRWFKGGIGINFLGYLVGFELFTVNILLLLGLFFLNFEIYLSLILVKIISELILISNTFQRFNFQTLYKYYPLFILYFAFYGLILPITFVFRRKITWKNQEY